MIISPAPLRSTLGNSITATRYARIFRSLGWHVRILRTYEGQPADCLVGLHALKSAPSILAFRKRYSERRIILVLTGTDLYRDIRISALAARAMGVADRLVTLQPAGIDALPQPLQSKAVSIIQSAPRFAPKAGRRKRSFRVCVLGHLRYEKDPMRAAYAVRKIDSQFDLRVVQAGGILQARYERIVAREMEINSRYHYVGALARPAALRLLAGSDLLVQSSRMEGGANAICEAIAAGVPVVASRISGNMGILGSQYPGLFRVADTSDLQGLLESAIRSPAFYQRLGAATEQLRPLVEEDQERSAWRALLAPSVGVHDET